MKICETFNGGEFTPFFLACWTHGKYLHVKYLTIHQNIEEKNSGSLSLIESGSYTTTLTTTNLFQTCLSEIKAHQDQRQVLQIIRFRLDNWTILTKFFLCKWQIVFFNLKID